jgi:transposase
MLTDLVLPWLSSLQLNELYTADDGILFVLRSTSDETACPLCAQPSAAVHSHYARSIADLPCVGIAMRLQVHVRKFFCRNPACTRQVFCERLPALALPYARRTRRLQQEQRQLGLDFGGEAGARTARRQGMPVSGDTILRLVRQTPLAESPTPRVLGVDDWALRKGQVYGTILVDLEQHQPVDLLPERSAETLAQWLQEHPGVEIISRDRATEYAEGAERGAPTAIQVADRFHLLQNVREMVQRLLERHQAALAAASVARALAEEPQTPTVAVAEGEIELPPPFEPGADEPGMTPPSAPVPATKAQREQAARRAARRERYESVRRLLADGLSQRQVARQLGLSVHTVRRYRVADQFPQRATRQVASKLDPFVPYLSQQLEAGHANAMQLWRDLRDQFGYDGSRSLVSLWVARHRHLCPETSAPEPRARRPGRPPVLSRPEPKPAWRLSARQAAWLLVCPPQDLDEKDGVFVEHLCQQATEVQTCYLLAQEFIQMVRERSVTLLEDWLVRVEASGISELQGFGAGIRRDQAAVMAALSLDWSNGQVEGQINRLKFIKRSMYGRAGFDLLRQRVLAA